MGPSARHYRQFLLVQAFYQFNNYNWCVEKVGHTTQHNVYVTEVFVNQNIELYISTKASSI